MATTSQTKRVPVSETTKKVDLLDFNGWTLNFTYEKLQDQPVSSVMVAGSKTGVQGNFTFNRSMTGTNINFGIFDPDIDLITRVISEVNDIISGK